MAHRARLFLIALLVPLGLVPGACGGGGDSAAAPVITAQPASQTVVKGQPAIFSITASGTTPLSYQWRRGGASIAGATASTYTTPATTSADNGATFAVVVSNAVGNTTSSPATLTVATTIPGAVQTDVATSRNDLARTGQNLTEAILTPANVNASTFGLLRVLSVDGKVDAQPLYLSHLTVGANVHNVVFIATEHDSVYAADADSGAPLWHSSALPAGEVPSDTRNCDQVSPEIGITATPVIDRAAGPHGVIYVVAMSKDGSAAYHQRLHALDVATGAELFGGPKEISAAYPIAGGARLVFDGSQYEERAALLLSQGLVYTSWTSHCDNAPYTGWIIAYDQMTLAQKSVLNVAPNSGGRGPAIWMAGGGPGVDSAGNIYLLTANGVFETTLDAHGFPSMQDYGNSFLKLAPTGTALGVADYFTPWDGVAESNSDIDLGSGGLLLLPDLHDDTHAVRHLVIGAGKDGNIYVANRDAMGKFNPSKNLLWQELDGVLPGGVWSTPAYFNSTVYYADVGGRLKAFGITNAKLSSAPTSQTSTSFEYPGTSPTVSANGTLNAIVWAAENVDPAVLHAYDATNLARELYNSNQAANGRDSAGAGNKFIAASIADGKVFFGTANSVGVFGLLH
jgi:Ig-like domain-containing protein